MLDIRNLHGVSLNDSCNSIIIWKYKDMKDIRVIRSFRIVEKVKINIYTSISNSKFFNL